MLLRRLHLHPPLPILRILRILPFYTNASSFDSYNHEPIPTIWQLRQIVDLKDHWLPPLTTIIPAYKVIRRTGIGEKWRPKWIQVGRASGDWLETARWNWRLELGCFFKDLSTHTLFVLSFVTFNARGELFFEGGVMWRRRTPHVTWRRHTSYTCYVTWYD